MTLEELLVANERIPHKPHQLEGLRQLVTDVDPERGRVIPFVFALLDEVGAGKSKQCVDAAQVRFLQPKLSDVRVGKFIDTILVNTPGYARSTWANPNADQAKGDVGEVALSCWKGVPNTVHEWHGDYTDVDFTNPGIHWIITNYEFLRMDNRRDAMLEQLRGRRVWHIVDESWNIKGHSDQMKACTVVRRRRAEFATILNGTPLSDGKPMDLYYQFAFLDPEIIGCKNVTHFKSKHCIFGGFQNRNIIGYKDQDELNRRIAPYVFARKTRDYFNLPEMLKPIYIEPRLDDESWKLYREMRDDMVTWLGTQVTMSKVGITKALRLAQICSGFLGGLEEQTPNIDPTQPGGQPMPDWLRKQLGVNEPPLPFGGPFDLRIPAVAPTLPALKVTKEINKIKQDAVLFFLKTMPVLPDQMLIWCRFKPELARMTEALKAVYPLVANLKGGQSPDDRALAKRLLAPGSTTRGGVVGNPSAGGASLNFSAANLMIYQSLGPRLIEYTQSKGRIERPGATKPMQIVFVRAAGPKGQKTIDHHIVASVFKKDDMARWTVDQWRQILAEE